MKIIIDLNMATLLNRNPDKDSLKHFVVEKEVHDSDSLHDLAISVMKESGVQEYIDYIDNTPSTPVVIFIKSKKITNILDAWKSETQGLFGIKYRINSDETIRLLEGYKPLYTDITFSELKEIVDNGYIDGDYNYLIIDAVQGLGAGSGVELTQIIETIGNVLTVYEISVKVISAIKKLVNFRKNRKWRKIAAAWKENNGFVYLKELRDFFDSKGNWKTKEIQKRLKISEQDVGELMRALGYELINNDWLLGQSKKANRRRNKWLSNEEKSK